VDSRRIYLQTIMLNIMLMRSIEAGIFDQTRAWLAADRTRVFHLVVDELHTYRGTPGTEVPILRALPTASLHQTTPSSDHRRQLLSNDAAGLDLSRIPPTAPASDHSRTVQPIDAALAAASHGPARRSGHGTGTGQPQLSDAG
jgi:hypothetical protein